MLCPIVVRLAYSISMLVFDCTLNNVLYMDSRITKCKIKCYGTCHICVSFRHSRVYVGLAAIVRKDAAVKLSYNQTIKLLKLVVNVAFLFAKNTMPPSSLNLLYQFISMV